MTVEVPGETGFSFFGVFDGHGGKYISDCAARDLLKKVMATDEWKSGARDVETITAALRSGFIQLDEELKASEEVVARDDHSGSTAVTALVTPTHIFVANCGDSRSIMVSDGAAIEMSHDHKPYLEKETKRIEEAGGTVAMKRVNGDLAVSRALGDFVYKRSAQLPPEKQQVSCEPVSSPRVRSRVRSRVRARSRVALSPPPRPPACARSLTHSASALPRPMRPPRAALQDVIVHVRNPEKDQCVARGAADVAPPDRGPSDPPARPPAHPPSLLARYLVLACDGVWDVVTNEACAAFLLEKAGEGCWRPQDLAGEIIDRCFELQSKDNMSAIVVSFPSAPSNSLSAEKKALYDQQKAAREAAKEREAAGGAGAGAMAEESGGAQ